MANRHEIADHIVGRMTVEKARMKQQYADSQGAIGYFYIDDVLPEEIALAIYRQFPNPRR